MISVSGQMDINNVSVQTSDSGGLSNEQIADLCLDKILSVSSSAPEPIREQALIFREQVKAALLHYIEFTKSQERATICSVLRDAGHNDIAELIRRL